MGEQEWSNWMKWNQCDVEKYNMSFENMANDFGKYECAIATKSEHECLAETRLCIFSETSHSEWARDFPLKEEVILFFLKALCEQNDGVWNEGVCECVGRENVGRYCDTKMIDVDIKWKKIEKDREHFIK